MNLDGHLQSNGHKVISLLLRRLSRSLGPVPPVCLGLWPAATRLRKGDKVYVSGKIQKRRFGEEGNQRLAVDIVCRGGPSDLFLLSRPSSPHTK